MCATHLIYCNVGAKDEKPRWRRWYSGSALRDRWWTMAIIRSTNHLNSNNSPHHKYAMLHLLYNNIKKRFKNIYLQFDYTNLIIVYMYLKRILHNKLIDFYIAHFTPPGNTKPRSTMISSSSSITQFLHWLAAHRSRHWHLHWVCKSFRTTTGQYRTIRQ